MGSTLGRACSRSRARMRSIRAAAIVTVAVVALLVAGASTALAASPTFSFTGSGYGHGIGLSQYGAKGWAEHGKTGTWIASYYYPGSTIATAPRYSVYVNIDNDASYSSSGNGGYVHTTWSMRPGYTTASLDLNSKVTLTEANGPYSFIGSGSTIVVKDKNGNAVSGSPFSGTLTVTPNGGPSPQLTQILGASGPFDHRTVRYRGVLRLNASLGKVRVVNKLTMQEYLNGVVPRESPASWPIDALRAQAIVARSYAYSPTSSTLYCTTSSQVYNGHSRGDRAAPTMHEDPRSNQAVDDTLDLYVTVGGSVVKTYFSASSGGYTANIEDVWTGATPKSYYTAVPDPYCASSYDPWSAPVEITGLSMAAKLAPRMSGEPTGAGTTIWVKALGVERAYPSGFVRSVDVTWSNGAVTKGVSGDTVRRALGLKSTKFYINSPFTRISSSDRYETAVMISRTTFTAAGSVKAAVLVNGTDAKFPDALTASALAGQVSGPVLIVPGTTMPASVESELKRLKTLGCTKVYIVGGTACVSADVEAQAKAAVGFTERLAGSARYGHDRYGTAATVAMKMKSLGAATSKVLVASGESWPDAAVAAAIAAGTHRPVVLTGSSTLPGGSRTLLKDLGATQTAVFGGTKAISAASLAAILSETGESTPAKRFGTVGSRYDVAVDAAKWAVSSLGYTLPAVYIVSGETFPDSVTGGLMAGRAKHPLLMTAPSSAASATSAYLASNRVAITKVVVVGGGTAVTDTVASLLASYAY